MANISTDLYNDGQYQILRQRLESDGYLFVRNVIGEDIAMGARRTMLRQAVADGSVLETDEISYEEARIAKQGGKCAKGYCLDANTGIEIHKREFMDNDAWIGLLPLSVFENVYSCGAVQEFWKNLFGEEKHQLDDQTFMRLVGRHESTVEHAVCISLFDVLDDRL